MPLPYCANNTCYLNAPIFLSGCISALTLLLNDTYLVLMLWLFPRLAPSPLSHRNFVGFFSELSFGFGRRLVLGRNKYFVACLRDLKYPLSPPRYNSIARLHEIATLVPGFSGSSQSPVRLSSVWL
jgi:hypothetical protein